MLVKAAADGMELAAEVDGQHWLMSWHGPSSAPSGTRHGSAGICSSAPGHVVVVSSDGARWELPAGRPERDESWEETLRREVLEEACATVTHSRLVGFVRGRCIHGREAGLVLVRSFWLADVILRPWTPAYEMSERKIVPVSEVPELLGAVPGYLPLYRRAFEEAGMCEPVWTVRDSSELQTDDRHHP